MTHREILEGSDDWLFLREGSNQSYSYLVGANRIGHETRLHWVDTIRRRLSFKWKTLHLIAPEKLAVFPEKLPGTVLDKTRFALMLAQNTQTLYPVEDLRGTFENIECYPKNDTHFNEAGAWVCAKLILDRFGIEWDFEPRWRHVKAAGDLGNKLSPQRRSESLQLCNSWSIEYFDNGLRNRGRVTLIRNAHVEAGRMLIFGDSFSGLNLARMLSGAVKEVLFVHSLSADYWIFREFQPDFVLFELAERFLRIAPSDGQGLNAILLEKALAGDLPAINAWGNAPDCPTRQFVQWDILEFILEKIRSESQ